MYSIFTQLLKTCRNFSIQTPFNSPIFKLFSSVLRVGKRAIEKTCLEELFWIIHIREIIGYLKKKKIVFTLKESINSIFQDNGLKKQFNF